MTFGVLLKQLLAFFSNKCLLEFHYIVFATMNFIVVLFNSFSDTQLNNCKHFFFIKQRLYFTYTIFYERRRKHAHAQFNMKFNCHNNQTKLFTIHPTK